MGQTSPSEHPERVSNDVGDSDTRRGAVSVLAGLAPDRLARGWLSIAVVAESSRIARKILNLPR